MDIRPHHGLCMQFFEGKGYDENFVAHMSQVIEEMKHNPVIRLVAGEDEICQCCPNNEEHCCNTPEKVDRYDRKVLSLCQLKEGTQLQAQEFLQLAREKILKTDSLSQVCGDCEWFTICHR